MKRSLLFFFLLYLPCHLFTKEILEEGSKDIFVDYEYFLSVRENVGRSLGSTCSYTTLESFSFPFHYQNIWPFLDLRAHCFNYNGQWAANVGLGVRFNPECSNQVFGINAYYDFRNLRYGSFHQIGLGLEWLGECFNFRLNTYLPIGNRSIFDSSCLSVDEGGYFVFRENFHRSLCGIDVEMETLICNLCCTEVYFAVGSYFYSGNKCLENLYGVEYRLSAYFYDYFNLTIIDTHDCRFKNRIQAQIGVTFSFNCIGNCWGLFEPVRRNELIVHDRKSRWTWNF